MIPGWENYTKSMSRKEIQAALIIAAYLPNHVGKDGAITGAKMTRFLKVKHNLVVSGPRLRHILHVLRCTHNVQMIKATSKGYYTAENYTEYLKYRKSHAKRCRHNLDLLDAIDRELESMRTGHELAQLKLEF